MEQKSLYVGSTCHTAGLAAPVQPAPTLASAVSRINGCKDRLREVRNRLSIVVERVTGLSAAEPTANAVCSPSSIVSALQYEADQMDDEFRQLFNAVNALEGTL